MAFALELNSFTKKERYDILEEFTIKERASAYDRYVEQHQCFYVDKVLGILYLPLGKWRNYIINLNNDLDLPFPNGESNEFLHMNKNITFKGELKTINNDTRKRDQNIVAKLAIQRLQHSGSVFISCHTGYGKTMLGIYLSIYLKLKTIILCHIKVVRNQWPGEYMKFSNGIIKIQFIKGKITELDPTADVYICGTNKASKLPRDLFYDIGTVIIDEAHIATTKTFENVLLKFRPRYLIGLSATPDRVDGLHEMFDLYFGNKNNFIIRREVKDFTVYKLQTKFEPEVRYTTVNYKTVPDWNRITNSIAECEERWELIVNVILNHPKEKIIVLCDRKVLATGIYNLLISKSKDYNFREYYTLFLNGINNGETYEKLFLYHQILKKVCIKSIQKNKTNINIYERVPLDIQNYIINYILKLQHISQFENISEYTELLIGNKQHWNKNARVLISGFKKGGVGLNDPDLTMLIIASDTTDVRQYEGRIRTTNNIVYHLVDNYKTFEKHWQKCEKWYKIRGANIKVIGHTRNFDNTKLTNTRFLK